LPYSPVAYLINHVNIATTRKKPKIKILISNKMLPLLRAMHKIGCISRYVYLTKYKKNLHLRYVILTIPFFKQKPFFKSIRLISTSSKKYNVSLKALQLIANSLRSSCAILSTPYGVLTHREALKLKTGGLILCIIH
jgi:ribosomal protein S8